MMQAPRSRPNSALKAPPPLPNEQAYIRLIRKLGNMNPGIYFVLKLWDDVTSLCSLEVFLHMFLVLFIVHNVTPELPPRTPCKVTAFPRHLPCCTYEPWFVWDVFSTLPPIFQNTGAQVSHPRNFVATPDFIALAQLQSRLEYVMEQSTHSSLVAINMRSSDMALRDLGTLVRYSSLPSKDILERDLRYFVEGTKATSKRLQQFRQHVWGAVGRIVHENNHAITVLQGVLLEVAEESRDNNFHLLRFFGRGTALRQKKMKDVWIRVTILLEKILRESIVEAQDNIVSLEMLDQGIGHVQNMVLEGEDILRSVELGLKRRWFPEERKLGPHSTSFKLLLIAQDHCEVALIHMKGIRSRLEEMSLNLIALRTVASGSTIDTTTPPHVSIEVYIKKVQNVTKRLHYGQVSMTKAVDAHRRERALDQPASTNFIEN